MCKRCELFACPAFVDIVYVCSFGCALSMLFLHCDLFVFSVDKFEGTFRREMSVSL